MLKKILLSALVLCIILTNTLTFKTNVSAETQISYYVSPSGNDSNPGTESQPFLTIQKACDIVRTINSNMTGDIYVYLRGGTYTLTSTLALTQSDSGTNGFNVIYKAYTGEVPIISGGQTITGWTLYDSQKNIYRASVDASLETRQIYINSVRGIRARSTGGLPGASITTTGYTTTDSNMQNWGNKSDIEFVYEIGWVQMRSGVSDITGTTVTMKQPGWDMNNNKTGIRIKELCPNPNYMENAYELLDTEGEWYLDRTADKLYYRPRTGEDMSTATVIAAKLETLIDGSGTLDNPIHNIQFEGVTFEYATWLNPNGNEGFAQIQADAYQKPYATREYGWDFDNCPMMPANIKFTTAKNIRFERNKFIHLGSSALGFQDGSQDNIISGNEITDISGSGIQIGGIGWNDCYPTDVRNIVKNNSITNNYIHQVAVEYKGCVGVLAGFVENTTIAHNEICDLPYTGISIGWGWGRRDFADIPFTAEKDEDISKIENNVPSTSKDNKILYNHIYNIVNYLDDGGGIYSVGAQPGEVIEGNYIHEDNALAGAIYLDNGSRYVTVRNNILHSNNKSNYIVAGANTGNDNDLEFNYLDQYKGYWGSEFPNMILENNFLMVNRSVPQYILDNVGLEASYRDLSTQQYPVYVPVNVAYKKYASAYYIDGSAATMQPGSPASNAVDGDLGTIAQASNQFAWVEQVDLGFVCNINRVTTTFGAGTYATEYDIQVSEAGGSFTTVKSVIGCTGGVSDQTFTPVNARYIRIKAVKPDGGGQTGGQMGIAELEVFEYPNLALNKSASAYYIDGSPAQMQPGSTPGQAVDGDINTMAQATNQFVWIEEVDLGCVYNINRVKTTFGEGAYATEYDIQVSETGSSFTTVKSVTGCTGGVSDQTFASVDARYVRIKAVKPDGPNQTGGQMGITELEVFKSRNLAYNMPASAYYIDGSAAAMQPGSTPSQAVDGLHNTKAQATNQFAWIEEVDLGYVHSINRVKTTFGEGAYATEYDIQVSTTGDSFTTVKSVTGCTGGVSDQTFAPVDARYVRIKAVKPDEPNQTGGQMSVAELEVNGTAAASASSYYTLANPIVPDYNIACGRKASAYYIDGSTATMQPGSTPGQAVDNDPGTVSQATNQFAWIQEVDLGYVHNINRVTTTFGAGTFATEYDIQVSETGSSFTTVKSVTGCTGGVSEQTFTPVNARYVRIKAVKPDGPDQTGGQMGIAELNVYEYRNISYKKTASAYYNDGSPAAMQPNCEAYKGVDGTTTTTAQATNQIPWTYQVDLGALYDVDQIEVRFSRTAWATDFEIQGSTTGASYTVLASVSGLGVNPLDERREYLLKLNPYSTMRYVRIKAIKPDGPSQTGGQMAIAELKVTAVVDQAIKISEMTDSNRTGDKYYYRAISNQGFTFQAGDVIAYDVKLCTNDIYIGGIDIQNTDETVFRTSGWQDQNGITGSPYCDLRSVAYGKWYHREMTIPSSMAGKTTSAWMLALENDSVNKLLQAEYSNIIVKRSGSTVLTVYKNGSPAANTLMYKNLYNTDAPAGFVFNRN